MHASWTGSGPGRLQLLEIERGGRDRPRCVRGGTNEEEMSGEHLSPHRLYESRDHPNLHDVGSQPAAARAQRVPWIVKLRRTLGSERVKVHTDITQPIPGSQP